MMYLRYISFKEYRLLLLFLYSIIEQEGCTWISTPKHPFISRFTFNEEQIEKFLKHSLKDNESVYGDIRYHTKMKHSVLYRIDVRERYEEYKYVIDLGR